MTSSMQHSKTTTRERLLTVDQAADRLNVGDRYVRRLITERRITFVRVGRYVRIPEPVLDDFIAAGRVEPRLPRPGHDRQGRAA